MKSLIVCAILFLQGCGPLNSHETFVCDHARMDKKVNTMREPGETSSTIEPNEIAGDQTLLLFRMLNTL